MSEPTPNLPFENLPEPSILPVAWSGGVHDGSRIDEAEKAVMREMFVKLGSVHAVAKATGHGWKVTRAVCCPETAFEKVDQETVQQVQMLRANGARYQQIKAETGLPLSVIAAIISADPKITEVIKKTRAARLLVQEDMLMEAQTDAVETKLEAGKLSVADATNALMVNGVLHKEAGGSAPTRIRHEADPTFLAAAAMFGAVFKPKPVLPAESVQEAVVVSKETQPEPVENSEA